MFGRKKLVIGIGDDEFTDTLPFSIRSAATTNATLVKGGPGVITSLSIINKSAAVLWVKFYDSKDKPIAGSGTPVRVYAIPGATTGAGIEKNLLIPMRFQNGIGFTITGGAADNDTTAVALNDITMTGEYR